MRSGAKGAHELSAAGQITWLDMHGAERGWQVVSMPEARGLADQGRPVVAVYRAPTLETPSHVAMLLPTPMAERFPRIAQAGAQNLFDVPLPRGFGALKVQFWTHD